MRSLCGFKLLGPINFFCHQGARLACGGVGVVCLKELESHCAVSSTVPHLQCARGVAEAVHAQHISPSISGCAQEPKVPQCREAQTAWADCAGEK